MHRIPVLTLPGYSANLKAGYGTAYPDGFAAQNLNVL
jgi:hypothetical protein